MAFIVHITGDTLRYNGDYILVDNEGIVTINEAINHFTENHWWPLRYVYIKSLDNRVLLQVTAEDLARENWHGYKETQHITGPHEQVTAFSWENSAISLIGLAIVVCIIAGMLWL